jgi:hypothetical protein
VALNDVGGFGNTMTLVLTGLDIEAKAARAEELLLAAHGGRGRFAEVDVRLLRLDRPDAPSDEQATAHLRIRVSGAQPTLRAPLGSVVGARSDGLPKLRAVNEDVHGLLGDGVAASARPDPQAEGLGEYLRSPIVDVPGGLL